MLLQLSGGGGNDSGVKAPDKSKPPRPSTAITTTDKPTSQTDPEISYLSDGTRVVRLNEIQRLRWLEMKKASELIEHYNKCHSQHDWLFFVLQGLYTDTAIKRYRDLWWLYKELIRINDYIKNHQHPIGKGVFTERDIKVLETILTPMGWYFADPDDIIPSLDEFEKDVVLCRMTGKRLRWVPMMPQPWKKGEEDAVILACMGWMATTFGEWLLSGNRCVVASMTRQFFYTRIPGCSQTFKDVIAMSLQGINIPSPTFLSMVNFALMYYPKMIPTCEVPPEPETVTDPCRPDKGAKVVHPIRAKLLTRALAAVPPPGSPSSMALSSSSRSRMATKEGEPPLARIQKSMAKDTAWLLQEQRIYPKFPDGLN
jgi:hypothetical protein